jgi:hypothetical protein
MGAKKMPPPVPVIPETKPIAAPVRRAGRYERRRYIRDLNLTFNDHRPGRLKCSKQQDGTDDRIIDAARQVDGTA